MEPISKVKTFIGDLTQYGITWEFDKEYECGQFITGDYWVIGPIAIIGIIPQSASDGGIIRNGSQINPVPFMTDYTGSDNGYDSRIGKYRSGLNVAMGISPSSPLILPIGSSLVSTVSIQADNRPQLSDAAVLTVLESAPPDGSFRPPYCGSDKTIKFNKSQINYAILPSLSLSEITANPNLAAIGMTRRPWIDHFTHPGNQTQYVSPQNNMPNYGREYSSMIGELSLMLMMDQTELTSKYGTTKEDIAIGLIQIGIDNYEVLKNGGWWAGQGGLNHGRKWPILLAGILLNDKDMHNVGNFPFAAKWLSGVDWQYTPFAEDAQIQYVDQELIDKTNSDDWSPEARDVEKIRYTAEDMALPEWGININRYTWNKYWGAYYRQCCNATGWPGIMLSALILDVKSFWHNNVFFDYMDRYMDIESPGSWTRSWSKFSEQMWDKYRTLYFPQYVDTINGERIYIGETEEEEEEEMALTYLNTVHVDNNSQSPSFSVNIPSGADLCVLWIADYHTSPYENVVTALSLDGQAGSLIEYGAEGTSNEEGIAYSFVGFGSGSKTFSLTRSKVISEGAAYSFIFFSGANISNPIKDHDTAVKLGATPAAITTPNMDSGTDCIVLALCSAWNSTPTMTGGGQTLIESGLYNQTRYGVAFLAGTGATDTATATCEYARLIGVVVQPAAGGTIEGSGNVDAVGSVIQTQKLLLNQSGDVDSIGSGMQTQKLLLKQSGDIDTTSNLTETQKLLYKTSGNIDAAVDMTESNKLLYKLAGIIDAAVDMTQTGTLLLKISGEIDALADILFQYQDIVSVTATMDVSTDAAVSYRLLQKQLANIDAVGSVSLSSITIMLNAIIDTIGSMLAQQEVIGDVHFRLTAVMKNISELTSEIKNTSRLTTIIKI